MKDVHVFYGQDYYPLGGWDDYEASFDSIEEAMEYIKSLNPDDAWAHIVNECKIIICAKGIGELLKKHRWEFMTVSEK